MTALVSFERIFEILDLKPLVAEDENPVAIAPAQSASGSSEVDFSYPSADEVSVPSLELRPEAESL